MRTRRRRGYLSYFAVALFVPFICSGVGAQQPPQRPMTPDDVLRLEELGDLALSPDGMWLAYVVKRAKTVTYHKWDFLWGNDRADVWLVATGGGKPQNLTNGASDGSGFWLPVWSPDANRLAMLSTRGGNVRLWVWEKSSGTLKPLTARGVETFDLGNKGPVWVSDRELICPVLPQGERPLSMTIEVEAGEKAMREWPKAWKGDEATVSMLESGVPVDVSKRPQSELVAIDAATGAARAVTKAPSFRDLQPSPDKRFLALLVQTEQMVPDPRKLLPPREGKLFGAYLVNTSGNEAGTRIGGIREVFQGSLTWCPDGNRFAMVGSRIGSPQPVPSIFVCTSSGICETTSDGTIDPTPAVHDQPKLVWSAKKELLVLAKPSEAPGAGEKGGRTDWWLVSPSAAPRNVTASLKSAPVPLLPREDGSFVGVADGDLWLIETSTARSRNLTESFEPKIASIVWPKGPTLDKGGLTQVIVGVAKGQTTELYAIELPSGKVGAFAKPTPDATLAEFRPGEKAAVFTAATRGGTFLWLQRRGTEPTRVVEANGFLRGVAEGKTLQVEYRGLDGQHLKAWVILPVGYQEGTKYPLVTWVYAGSIAGEKPSVLANLNEAISLNLQLLAAHGYAVLLPSMPLSAEGLTSDPYMELSKGVLPAVDKVIELGIADPNRLGLMGQSFGGFSTYGLITQTTRFQAAVALAGLSDLASLYAQFDARQRYDAFPQEDLFYMFLAESGQERLGNPPWKDFGRYIRNSPIFYVDRVETPLMIIQGDMDYVAMQQGEQFFMSLYRQNKRAEFVRYWGEGHVLEGPANIRDMWQRIYAWFDEFLKAKSEQPPQKEKTP
jgi:dipeptidyl aminopeptidase/acylaminoacyl peptidase